MAKTLKITFNKEKDTKNAVRYQEAAEKDQEKIGSLYVQKAAFEGDAPAKIEVTLTY
jgi:outer membrane protein assembly factor BamE (lipoprotein component of BamABCDE complex)